jgi:GAF domain-containing protein
VSRRSDPAVATALSAALGSISQRAMSEAPLAEVMQLVMDLLRDAMGLQRVIICLRDDSCGDLVGRHGVGDRAVKLAALFRIPMQPPSDLFGLLCSRQADTLISDTTDAIITRRLPAWFTQQVKAPSFILLPLCMGERPIGLIYGDHSEANRLVVDDNELTLLKALRNQLAMAMRLRGFNG